MVTAHNYHNWQAQEWAIAERFSGIEIDCCAHLGMDEYDPVSFEENEKGELTAMYRELRPGSKVHRWGFIKGVNWYTLMGDVFVERLGGDAALRKALDRDDIRVERINHCVLVRAGPFPRLGAPEEGLPEPYVFVNKVLRVLRNPKPDGLHFYDPHLPNADNKERPCPTSKATRGAQRFGYGTVARTTAIDGVACRQSQRHRRAGRER